MKSPASEKRRALLAAGAGAAALQACSLLRPRSLTAFCPNDPEISSETTPLTIDVHAHVFNGTDLQVRRFIELVVPRQKDTFARAAASLGQVLQQLAWERAPTARQEMAVLRGIQSAIGQCAPGAHASEVARLKQDGYSLARRELNVALDRSQAAPGAAQPSGGAQLVIRTLPPTYDEYARRKDAPGAAMAAPGGADVAGLIDFAIQNFQYRYVSVHDYLRTYSRGAARKIDLLVASLVDYDWWLAKGGATPSSLRDQVEVMAEIAIATGGRVHAFAPFDPFREVMARRGATESSLAIVKDAVGRHGAIGVKLYPPMGFAPYGNSAFAVWQGKDWLSAAAHETRFGRDLDAVLAEFFDWCIADEVPVMAHTNQSNGPDPAFEALAAAERWKVALEALDTRPEKLRVNFGHFGDTTLVNDGSSRSEKFVALMKAQATQPGARAFADASYFSDILDNAAGLQAILERLYRMPQDRAGLLADRLMYGSDWEMSLIEKNVEKYLAGFEATLAAIERNLAAPGNPFNGLANKFFGRNAAEFLGLARGRNRERIERFYGTRIAKPQWMKKVDAL